MDAPTLHLDQTAASAATRVEPVTCAMNTLSIDVEEYFHAEVFAKAVSHTDWPQMEKRSALCVERIGQLLAKYESKATFFVLGWSVDYLAPLLRHLVTQGHEIACHGFDHQHISRLTPEQFADDLKRAKEKIEDKVGVRPRGYRAPTFSVTHKTAWALDAIIDAGFEYDASIFPIHHDRYGVPNAPDDPFRAIAPSGRGIIEFPPMTQNLGFAKLPVGGGGYFRLFPSAVVHTCIALRHRQGKPVMMYMHPWEIDPGQPRLPAGRLSTWRHRVNLDKTEDKLAKLLDAFHFDTASRVLRQIRTLGDLPEYSLTQG